MQIVLWLVLIMVFSLGFLATLISQFTVARKGLEVNAKAKNLRESVNSLVERNGARRENLKRRQEVLDTYLMKDIEHQKGQLDDSALKNATSEERKRVATLTKAISDSENMIIENRKILAEVERKRALNSGWLLFMSGCAGGVTAVIFSFIGYLGTVPPVASLATSVDVTSNLIMQSLLLGAGWPVVWEKVFAIDKLESTASAAVTLFQNTIKEVEKDEV